jgi:hypothetical protein
MSLDIFVYRNLRRLEPQPTEEERAALFHSSFKRIAEVRRNPELRENMEQIMDVSGTLETTPEENPRGYTYVCNYPEFVDWADGIQEGCYSGTFATTFGAGGYGSYNEWRAQLCRMAHGVEPDVLWENPAEWKGKSFYELIDFADDHGTIGPKTSAKLYRDFVAWQDKAQTQDSEVEDFSELYRLWMEAFRLASQDGVVRFL